jgi:hypothetical protein
MAVIIDAVQGGISRRDRGIGPAKTPRSAMDPTVAMQTVGSVT